MNKKGQFFSIDFIIAVSLGILFLGLLLGVSETKIYSLREEKQNNNLINETNTKLISFLNGDYSCYTDNQTKLPFSIDLLKIGTSSPSQIKNYLKLEDKNTQLIIGNITKINELLNKDIIAVDFEALICTGKVDTNKLIDCLNGNECIFQKEKIILKVTK